MSIFLIYILLYMCVYTSFSCCWHHTTDEQIQTFADTYGIGGPICNHQPPAAAQSLQQQDEIW
jgi:hypothetical protein